jgi:hypothetical protein
MESIVLGIVVIVAFFLISRWLKKSTYHDPPNGTLYDHDKMHGDPEVDELDEHDPRNLDLDKTLKNIKLRNKLKKIEKNDVDIDYLNPEGK